MRHAYSFIYLEEASANLGEAFDYAVNCCHLEADEFLSFFIASGLARRFGRGDPSLLVGLSGTELAKKVIEEVGLGMDFPPTQIEYEYSCEFWCGYILAYYQWWTGASFYEIARYLSMKDIIKLYPLMHESDEDRFVDLANKIIASRKLGTNLQSLRRDRGLTQKELSLKAGISLRSLQQYESRAKDINKAAGITLSSLARSLDCQIEDLLEMRLEQGK